MNYKAKKWLKYIAFAVVGALLCGSIMVISGNASTPDFLARDKNTKNLIKLDNYLKDGTDNYGVEWKVSDDGTIKLYGTASSDHSIEVTTVDLEAGTYTYSDGQDKANKGEFYSCVLYGAGASEAVAGTEDATFEIAEAQTVTIVITWADTTEFGNVLGTAVRPCLVEGENPGDFYVK